MDRENTHEKLSAFANAQEQILSTCDYFDQCEIHGHFFEILSRPNRVIEVSIPVRMDDGQIRIFTGYRSQHSNARGPYK